jgi:hypothetical protein
VSASGDANLGYEISTVADDPKLLPLLAALTEW